MRRPRETYRGIIAHVGTRGNDRRSVLGDDVLRMTFMRMFARIAVRYSWAAYAWCLMTTHYHLVIHAPEGGLSEGMRDLNGGFARWSNRYLDREDHVFGKRFGSTTINTDEQLLAACRYVVLNPVKATICREAGEWQWSSFLATVGAVHAPSFLAVGALSELFHQDPVAARKAYRDFVAAGIDADGHVVVPGTVPRM